MNRALHLLANEDLSGEYVYDSLYATHLYVKINPQDSTEASQILNDTNIAAFPYPLDYELIGTGEYQPGPNDDTNAIYTVVPIDYSFGTISYEVLEECVIPDDDEYLEEVERVSLILTGNLDEPIKDDKANVGKGMSSRKATGRPSGVIRVYNTTTGQYEGVRNIKVTMNSIVRVRTAWTDNSGAYSCSTKFLTNINYTISFTNRSGFVVWHGLTGILPPTMGLGVHSPSGYTYNMGTNSYGWYYATVNNGICVFTGWLCSSLGLPQPPRAMRIAAVNNSSMGTGSAPLFRIRNTTYMMNDYCGNYSLRIPVTVMFLPDVIIAKNSGNTYSVYRTVFHELSHVLHYQRVDSQYWERLMIGEVLLSFSSGYGNPSSIYAGYIGISEGWAYYADYLMSKHYLANLNTLINVSDTSGESHMHNHSAWFRPNLFYKLDSVTPNWGIQNYYYLLASDIDNMCSLKEAIVDDLTIQFRRNADSLLVPVCPTMFTEDPNE